MYYSKIFYEKNWMKRRLDTLLKKLKKWKHRLKAYGSSRPKMARICLLQNLPITET